MKTRILSKKMACLLGGAAICAVSWLAAVEAESPDAVPNSDLPSYTFVTLAGKDVPASSGSGLMMKPWGLAVDRQGDIYFTDMRHQVVCRLASSGAASIIAGKWDSAGSADGRGAAARFHNPEGIALDSQSNLYVTDSGNDTIRRITPAGVVTTLAGKARSWGNVDGRGDSARFNYPCDIAADSSGTLYVADLYNFVIRKVTPGGMVTTLAGQPGKSGYRDGSAREAEFDSPTGIAADDSGNIYVADTFKNSIRKITATGRVTTVAGQSSRPGHTDGKGRAAQFFHPIGLAADSAGNVYVADSDNRSIRRICPDGAVISLGGLAEQTGNTDGTGSAARFGHPFRIALDGEGNVYVTDLDNWAIRKGIPAPINSTSLTLNGPQVLGRDHPAPGLE